MSFYHTRRFLPQRFRLVLCSVLQASGLPFSEILTEDEITEAFDEEESWFAREEGDIFTPPLTLWAFLSQVLYKGEQRSCLAAVSRVIVLLVALGRDSCANNSGGYCKARAKLRETVLERMTTRVPVPFGICTLRTGGARYVPDLARSSSDWRFSSRFSAYSAQVCPSTPTAPSLRVR